MDRSAFNVLALATSYSLLVLLFVALRLTGEVTWSWIWILAPLWLPIVLTGVVFTALAAMLERVDVP